MWEIPTSVFLVCVTFLLKLSYDKHIIDEKKALFTEEMAASMTDIFEKHENLSADFSEVRKRVDVLTLKAGFNL
jgi:hypothetical protein